MAENGTSNGGAAGTNPLLAKMRVLGQFIRDMSFENVVVQSGTGGDMNPDINVKVNLDAKKRAEDQYEVSIKLNITSKAKSGGQTLFLLELDYVGIFHVEGLPSEALMPYVFIECPRMMFPYLRRIVSDITTDGGFPPLNLDNIDFVRLYQAEVQRRKDAEAGAAAINPS